MLSQQDNIDNVDIERISQNSFDVTQDMLDNETEDNTNSWPELENVINIEIDNDADAKNDTNDDNALFVSQTSQAEHDSDVDEINEGIYMQIKTKFGTFNRSTFKKRLKTALDVKSLRDSRQALFDLAKKKRYDCSDGRLVERLPRTNSAPVEDKLSEDIYIIFHFIDGENNYSDMKSCISKWALKHNYETRSSQRLIFFRSDCISQSPKAPVNDNALQRIDEDDDRMRQYLRR
ncbi:hypothetical protein ACJMK2_038732 [Sinanodonta woodiana]|uniref:Uncharacterized protein n=1 Tax=Sinanodonta woodiana TaxID=1069815 RepID=A0ABD3WD68_SINWO